jgi:hypothetical protein
VELRYVYLCEGRRRRRVGFVMDLEGEGGGSTDLKVYPGSTAADEADARCFREEDVVDVRDEGAV